mgnify:CR=1 FL=1
MDAVKFIEERNRMCKAYSVSNEGCCIDCPARHMECNGLNGMTGVTGTDIVKVVEKWSAAHPRKTRQDVFLAQWPNAPILHDGFLGIKPCSLDEEKGKKCGAIGCMHCRREFWGEVVE